MRLHLKLKQEKSLARVTDCVYACVCDAFNQPSGTERAFLLFQYQLPSLTVMNFDFDTLAFMQSCLPTPQQRGGLFVTEPEK